MTPGARPASVSVVIPTAGRPAAVTRAVRSALAQTRPPDEVVVVVDGPDPATVTALADLDSPGVRVVTLARNRGAATARNAGISASSSELIAFLDDDDEWLPRKLQVQLAVYEALPSEMRAATVVSCAVEWRAGETVHHWPTRGIRPEESVADYLFVRRRAGEGLLATPTLVVPRDLALEQPFDGSVASHEDYDWLLRLQARGARFTVPMETLVVVNAPPVRQSLSRTESWRDSLTWAEQRRHRLGGRAFSAFCLTEVARTARRQAGFLAFAQLLLAATRGRPTAYELVRYVAIWILPERTRWRLSGRRASTPPATRVQADVPAPLHRRVG